MANSYEVHLTKKKKKKAVLHHEKNKPQMNCFIS